MPDNKPNYKKLVADSKREALAAQAGRKKSVFGTTDSQFTATPLDFNELQGGKYAEVAKEENWDKYTIPPNADERLQNYNNSKTIKYILIGLFIFSIIILSYYLIRKKSIKENN